ncbi:ABC transporter ATP-binding protein [Irregularibacter muris]|uniref:ABC transporter ATP-binding protein n=1 Tax=Irregularibacter muris TaxID=1796619 RepID=A0AAE3HIS2_9FIRM|nr:ABC transporter ATP-binding protein [Irregularibacter muris]MCR1899938.1 ABC transporter ATP-binding protein [Irregularibacter muris]
MEKENTCLKIENLSKEFVSGSGRKVQALENVNIEIEENDFVCIVGPSGCGKSTLLRIIAGLEHSTTGKAFYYGKEIKKPTRDIGMIFQQYSLLPWKTVEENIILGLEFRREPKTIKKKIATKYLEMIGMSDFHNAYPFELSGGMQQRVAIARGLANDPIVLLMDEPFGALDAHTRILMQRELLYIWEKNRKTILFITHSVDEAIYLADKIIVMSHRPGKVKEIINIDKPRPRDRAEEYYGRLSNEILNMLEEKSPSLSI